MEIGKMGKLLSIITLSVLTIGCGGGGGSSSSTTTEPTVITTPESNGSKTTTLSSSEINAGVVSKDVIITSTTSDNLSRSLLTIPSGTAFTDENGTTLTNVNPKVELGQQTDSSSTTTEKVYSVQTEVKITDTQGNKIVPTEAVEVKIRAPKNSRPGDLVSLSIPDGAEKGTDQQKLVIFMVDANGFLTVKIFPRVFRNLLVIVIIIQKRIPFDQATN